MSACDDEIVGQIGPGLLAFVAVEPGDDDATARRLVDRAVSYRVFGDDAGRMNLSLADTGGELLLVSQFTLAADTRKGLRPSFTTAARARTRPTTVRAGRRIRPCSAARQGGHGPLRRRHEGLARERRPRHVLVAVFRRHGKRVAIAIVV